MRIVLAEIRDEQKLTSREFNQIDLKLGRDEQRCDLIFAQSQWPMVSRLHAELRLEGSQYYLVDLKSRHGTFLNGQRITTPSPVQPGSRIQLGPKGPVVSVELTEAEAAVQDFSHTLVDVTAAEQQAALRAEEPQPSQAQPPTGMSRTLVDRPDLQALPTGRQPQPSRPLVETPPPPVLPPKRHPILICESGSVTQVGGQFVLNNERTLLGRDPSADIQIDAAAAVVSRRHAEIRRQPDGTFMINDLGSFNGTLLNQQLISKVEPLHNGDQVQLGTGGPILRFSDPANELSSVKATPSALTPIDDRRKPDASPFSDADIGSRTIVYLAGSDRASPPPVDASGAQLIFQRNFDGKQKLSVGRGPDNDIQLDGLLISKHHASFINTPQGVMVEEAGSTNGVYLNGGRVTSRQPVGSQDVVQIGPFVLRADVRTGIAVFDTRAKTRIDAIGITEVVARTSGRGSKKLLDDVSLAIQANEFVGVLGPSGAGKSTLINALNGMRRTTNGRVLINNLELYQHIDSLKQSIGYVPQDDIIHRELTVYRTLYYVAQLRLSRDVPKSEIDQIIAEVLEVTGLTSRRDVLVSQLSGGQRKRVSIAVELITKPSVIFLDEPTSGLDPAAEERIMKLFRQIAESGRTVILTTHAMENVRLFDKVVLLMGGKLIFYGTPEELLTFVGAANFVDLYNKIEEPVELEIAKLGSLSAKVTKDEQRSYEARRSEIADGVAEGWRRRYEATEVYRQYVAQPLSQVQKEARTAAAPRRSRSLTDALLQWVTLVRRYSEVLSSDKWNLLILFGQAPIIGLLTSLVVGKNDPRDFPFFILALVSIWFGTSVAVRELVKERAIFRRERMVNLRLLSYVGSKLWVLSIIVGLQTTLLFFTLKIFDFAGLLSLPGLLFGLPQLLVLALTGIVGVALGLFVSAVVRTSEVATSMVPLILIPQILFAGLITVPTNVSRVIGAAMPATWSFDEIKRLSTLDTLKEEGSDPEGPNKGKGLLNHTKDLNTQNIKDARQQLEDYQRKSTKSVEEYTRRINEMTDRSNARTAAPGVIPTPPKIGTAPPIPDAVEIGDDLSGYVSFLHPWGSHVVNLAILILMLFSLFGATLIAVKTQDTR